MLETRLQMWLRGRDGCLFCSLNLLPFILALKLKIGSEGRDWQGSVTLSRAGYMEFGKSKVEETVITALLFGAWNQAQTDHCCCQFFSSGGRYVTLKIY